MSNIFRKHPLPWSYINESVYDAKARLISNGKGVTTKGTVRYLVERVNKERKILRSKVNFRPRGMKRGVMVLMGEYFWPEEGGFYTRLDFHMGDYMPPENFEVVTGD